MLLGVSVSIPSRAHPFIEIPHNSDHNSPEIKFEHVAFVMPACRFPLLNAGEGENANQ
jgi:predicted metalloenzyme YecM